MSLRVFWATLENRAVLVLSGLPTLGGFARRPVPLQALSPSRAIGLRQPPEGGPRLGSGRHRYGPAWWPLGRPLFASEDASQGPTGLTEETVE